MGFSSEAKLFICAVGVPPAWAMQKLHAAQVLVANMVGSLRNTEKALEAKVEPRLSVILFRVLQYNYVYSMDFQWIFMLKA